MMRLTDATKLAATKLRTRKVRLIVTVVVAGLMFSVLASASLIFRGTLGSLSSFNREGFGDRYIVAASGRYDSRDPAMIPEIIDRAVAIQKDTIAKRTALAKKLAIPYDSKSEPPVLSQAAAEPGKPRALDLSQPASQQALREYFAKNRNAGQPELEKQASGYNPVGFYEGRNLNSDKSAYVLHMIEKGKEIDKPADGRPQDPEVPSSSPFPSGFNESWGLLSQDLLKPFVLPNTSTTIDKDGAIPIIAPFNAVEKMLGYKQLPAKTKPAEQLQRIRDVRSKANTISFEMCYRNSTSNELLSKAISQQKELEANKNNKEYTKPQVIYSVPAAPCALPTIASDTRTADEKKADSNDEQMERTSGYVAPAQSTLRFRVAGLAPGQVNEADASFVSLIINGIVSSNLGNGGASWFTPIEVAKQQPLLNEIFPTNAPTSGFDNSYYVEFTGAKPAKSFIEKGDCAGNFGPPAAELQPGFDAFKDCKAQGSYFDLSAFGSNSLALDDAKQIFGKVFGYLATGIAVVASIIMIGTVGRTIADSRRETAVFRAIGAKKTDIIQIYLIYTTFLSLLVFASALTIGFLVSQFVDQRYSDQVTIQTLVAFNAQDLSKVFHFYGFYFSDIARLLVLSIASGFLSAFFPLVRNLRRNPIRDMRDDT